jgi:hypothetical protein
MKLNGVVGKDIADVLDFSGSTRTKIFYEGLKMVSYTTTDSQKDDSIIFTASEHENAEIVSCENTILDFGTDLYAKGYIDEREFSMFGGKL